MATAQPPPSDDAQNCAGIWYNAPAPVAALSVAQSLATTDCLLALERGLLLSAVCGRFPSLNCQTVDSISKCAVPRAGRRAGGRPGDVMSDLSAACIAANLAQCRESRAARARSAESTRSTGRATRQKPIVKVNERPSLGRVGGRVIFYLLHSTPQPSPLTD